jgi:hypothetical protein
MRLIVESSADPRVDPDSIEAAPDTRRRYPADHLMFTGRQ